MAALDDRLADRGVRVDIDGGHDGRGGRRRTRQRRRSPDRRRRASPAATTPPAALTAVNDARPDKHCQLIRRSLPNDRALLTATEASLHSDHGTPAAEYDDRSPPPPQSQRQHTTQLSNDGRVTVARRHEKRQWHAQLPGAWISYPARHGGGSRVRRTRHRRGSRRRRRRRAPAFAAPPPADSRRQPSTVMLVSGDSRTTPAQLVRSSTTRRSTGAHTAMAVCASCAARQAGSAKNRPATTLPRQQQADDDDSTDDHCRVWLSRRSVGVGPPPRGVTGARPGNRSARPAVPAGPVVMGEWRCTHGLHRPLGGWSLVRRPARLRSGG